MKLEEKIKDRIVVYQLRPEAVIARELAVLYLELALRKIARTKVIEACDNCLHWSKIAGYQVPEYIDQLSCWAQREELKKILCQKENSGQA